MTSDLHASSTPMPLPPSSCPFVYDLDVPVLARAYASVGMATHSLACAPLLPEPARTALINVCIMPGVLKGGGIIRIPSSCPNPIILF